ncbi:hypothetical protein ASD19_10825 [Microbacterium sp. Root53]|uniref:hypothetical protein n=1 Tax=Microbacterium sp. Root53 TaxID=1736553 RepID=UPI0006F71A6B|nr:hypothetical protein [Microbacterium sp. Root53]KQZ10038.1 hypothetical protein ASD19_10825 [Microbacterium sp. Root53]
MTIVQSTSGVEIDPADDAALGGFTYYATDEDGEGWPRYLLPSAIRETPWHAVDYDERDQKWKVSLIDVDLSMPVRDAKILREELGRLIRAAESLNVREANRVFVEKIVGLAADRGWDLATLAEKAGPTVPNDDGQSTLPDVRRLQDLLVNADDLAVQEIIALCEALDLDPFRTIPEMWP